MPSNLFKFGDWIYIAPLAVLGVILGVYGFMTCADCTAVASGYPSEPVGLLPALTRTLALIKATGSFPLDRSHWALFVAQIIMPALAFVSVLKVLLQNIRRDARVLLVQRLRDHVIVCGLGETGRQIVANFRDVGINVVAVTLDGSSPYALAAERRGVAVLEGDASQHGLLRLARIRHAKSLILTTGSDGSNLEIGMQAREMFARSPEARLTILSELRSQWLSDLIRSPGAGALGSVNADFRLFNLNNNAARALLGGNSFLRAVPEAGPQPHLLFLGFGRMASEILSCAVRSNFAVPGQRVSATVLDRVGEDAILPLQNASPGLMQLSDISCDTCEFGVDGTDWHHKVDHALQAKPPLWVIVAVGSDDVALAVATRVRAMLDQQGHLATPLFVRLRQQQRLGRFISELETQPILKDRLQPFGSLVWLTSPRALIEETLDILAKASHDVWLSHNRDSGSPAAVSWEMLPEFHKQANRGLADYIPVRLRACGFRLAEGSGPLMAFNEATVEKLAALEHYRWCTELKALGWRASESRDDFLKKHNRLVPWEVLPDSIKAYNREMARMLPQIADKAGMNIRRELTVLAGAPLPKESPHTQLVIVVDPAEQADWKAARDAVTRGAKLWVVLHSGSGRPVLQRLHAEVGDAEMLLSDSEYAALKSVCE